MKKFIILLAALTFSISAFAQMPKIDAKAKEFAKETKEICVKFTKGKDVTALTQSMGLKLAEYTTSVNNKAECQQFLLKYNEYVKAFLVEEFGEAEGGAMADAYTKNFYASWIASMIFTE